MSTEGLPKPQARTPLEQQLENFTPNSQRSHHSGRGESLPGSGMRVHSVSFPAAGQQESFCTQKYLRRNQAPLQPTGVRLFDEHLLPAYMSRKKSMCFGQSQCRTQMLTSKFRKTQIFTFLKSTCRVRTLLNLLAATKKKKKSPHEASPLL